MTVLELINALLHLPPDAKIQMSYGLYYPLVACDAVDYSDAIPDEVLLYADR